MNKILLSRGINGDWDFWRDGNYVGPNSCEFIQTYCMIGIRHQPHRFELFYCRGLKNYILDPINGESYSLTDEYSGYFMGNVLDSYDEGFLIQEY